MHHLPTPEYGMTQDSQVNPGVSPLPVKGAGPVSRRPPEKGWLAGHTPATTPVRRSSVLLRRWAWAGFTSRWGRRGGLRGRRAGPLRDVAGLHSQGAGGCQPIPMLNPIGYGMAWPNRGARTRREGPEEPGLLSPDVQLRAHLCSCSWRARRRGFRRGPAWPHVPSKDGRRNLVFCGCDPGAVI